MRQAKLFFIVFIILASACTGPSPSPVAQPLSPTASKAAATLIASSPTVAITPSEAPANIPTNQPTIIPTNSPTSTANSAPAGIGPDSLSSMAQLHTFRPFDMNSLFGLLSKGSTGGANLSDLQSSLFPPSYLAMAYSPDGQTLALGGCTKINGNVYDCPPPGKPILRLINAQTGDILREFQGHTSTVTGLAFSPDGKTLVSSSQAADGTIRFWDVSSGNMLRSLTISTKTGLPALAVSPDGSTLVAAWYQNLRVWDFNTGSVLLQGESSNGIPQFSKDGSRLAVYGSADRSSIAIYDTNSWKLVTKFTIPTQTLQLALSPDGKTLVTGGENNKGTLHFWDAASGKELAQATDSLEPDAMVYSPDGKVLFVGGVFRGVKSSIPLEMVSIWDPQTQKVIGNLSAPSISPRIMTVDPTGQHLAYADLGGDVSIWGQADDQITAARQVLMTYLDDLYQKKYADAAALYYSDQVAPNSPDYQFLKKSHPKLDLTNLPGVLQTTCEDKRFMCGKFRDLVYQGNAFGNGISFYVEFSAPDRSAQISPIPCSGLPSTCQPTTSFLFNLMQDAGGNYKLASLPPAAEFP
ncbi:MAG: hypothetical protein P4L50_09765 [Anaerolineaceae bacterium]|nr:hypothetical protein [Anaerolineaceae bacterium]